MHGGLREEASQGGQPGQKAKREGSVVADEGGDGQEQQQPKTIFGGFALTPLVSALAQLR